LAAVVSRGRRRRRNKRVGTVTETRQIIFLKARSARHTRIENFSHGGAFGIDGLGRDKNEQVLARAAIVVRLEKPSKKRDIAEKRNFSFAVLRVGRNQATNTKSVAILQSDLGGGFASRDNWDTGIAGAAKADFVGYTADFRSESKL